VSAPSPQRDKPETGELALAGSKFWPQASFYHSIVATRRSHGSATGDPDLIGLSRWGNPGRFRDPYDFAFFEGFDLPELLRATA